MSAARVCAPDKQTITSITVNTLVNRVIVFVLSELVVGADPSAVTERPTHVFDEPLPNLDQLD
jgi:hypothetical protein